MSNTVARTDHEHLLLPPIGTVSAWLKDLPGVPTNIAPRWVECNGQVLSDPESPLNGQTIPDLNGASGTQRFLRGKTTSGGTGGSESHSHSIPLTGGIQGYSGSKTHIGGGSTGGAGTLPSYYEVVWIIRVR